MFEWMLGDVGLDGRQCRYLEELDVRVGGGGQLVISTSATSVRAMIQIHTTKIERVVSYYEQ